MKIAVYKLLLQYTQLAVQVPAFAALIQDNEAHVQVLLLVELAPVPKTRKISLPYANTYLLGCQATACVG